jgi:hypothetical protein
MVKRIGFVAALLITIASASNVAWSALAAPLALRVREIRAPLLGTPAIVEAGKSFPLKIKLPPGRALANAYLMGIDSPSEFVKIDASPAAPEGDVAVFSATVPAGTPEKLYNLAIQFDNDWQWDYQQHAVKVISQYKTDFDFVHLTDIHFNLQDIKGKNLNRVRQRLLRDITKENPEFVIFSGDLGESPHTYNIDYVYGYEQFVQWLRVPIYMVPGNHELYRGDCEGEIVDGVDYWAATYGPAYFSFNYGAMHFVGLDDYEWPASYRNDPQPGGGGPTDLASLGAAQWQWLQNDLAASASRGNSCVAFAHIPIETLMGGKPAGVPPNQFTVEGPDAKQFTGLLNNSGCTHIFVGHLHFDSTNRFGKLMEVLTKAAGITIAHKESGWFYRIVHVRGGKITGWDYHKVTFDDL